MVVLAASAAATKRLDITKREVPFRILDAEAESLKAVLGTLRGLKPSLPASAAELLILKRYGAFLLADCLCVGTQFDLGFRECVISMALMWRSALSRMADPVVGPPARANADRTALRTYGAIDERPFRTVHVRERVTLLPPIPVRRANLSKGVSPTHGLPCVLKHQRGIRASTRDTLRANSLTPLRLPPSSVPRLGPSEQLCACLVDADTGRVQARLNVEKTFEWIHCA